MEKKKMQQMIQNKAQNKGMIQYIIIKKEKQNLQILTKKIEKKYIKEKYKVTKKKSQGDEIITSLSSEETNNRNNIKKK